MEAQPAAWSIQLLSGLLWIYVECGSSCPCFQRPFQDHHYGFYKCFPLFLFPQATASFFHVVLSPSYFLPHHFHGQNKKKLHVQVWGGKKDAQVCPFVHPCGSSCHPCNSSCSLCPLWTFTIFVVRGWNVSIVICSLFGIFSFPPL